MHKNWIILVVLSCWLWCIGDVIRAVGTGMFTYVSWSCTHVMSCWPPQAKETSKSFLKLCSVTLHTIDVCNLALIPASGFNPRSSGLIQLFIPFNWIYFVWNSPRDVHSPMCQQTWLFSALVFLSQNMQRLLNTQRNLHLQWSRDTRPRRDVSRNTTRDDTHTHNMKRSVAVSPRNTVGRSENRDTADT